MTLSRWREFCKDDVNSQLLEQETETCSHLRYMYCFELIPP